MTALQFGLQRRGRGGGESRRSSKVGSTGGRSPEKKDRRHHENKKQPLLERMWSVKKDQKATARGYSLGLPLRQT